MKRREYSEILRNFWERRKGNMICHHGKAIGGMEKRSGKKMKKRFEMKK